MTTQKTRKNRSRKRLAEDQKNRSRKRFAEDKKNRRIKEFRRREQEETDKNRGFGECRTPDEGEKYKPEVELLALCRGRKINQKAETKMEKKRFT
ncbi:hypothetical protein L195_g061578, partial [Trifolium pratense]